MAFSIDPSILEMAASSVSVLKRPASFDTKRFISSTKGFFSVKEIFSFLNSITTTIRIYDLIDLTVFSHTKIKRNCYISHS